MYVHVYVLCSFLAKCALYVESANGWQTDMDLLNSFRYIEIFMCNKADIKYVTKPKLKPLMSTRPGPYDRSAGGFGGGRGGRFGGGGVGGDGRR